MKNSIVWLASYPKSGNTWVRAFLANYLSNAQTPVSINDIHKYGVGDNILGMYQRVAGGPLDLKDTELSVKLRGKVLAGIVANNADVNLVKTHNINNHVYNIHLIPPQVTRSAIYIMRNPLDMVSSYARHFGLTVEDAAHRICHPHNGSGAYEKNVATFMGSWSEHVKSWTRALPYPVLVLRYEDMLAQPEVEFAKVVQHFGMPVDPERLARAIKNCSFDELKRQESEQEFIERSEYTDKFFVKGQSGQWKDELSRRVIKDIKRGNREVMKKYGYWDE